MIQVGPKDITSKASTQWIPMNPQSNERKKRRSRVLLSFYLFVPVIDQTSATNYSSHLPTKSKGYNQQLGDFHQIWKLPVLPWSLQRSIQLSHSQIQAQWLVFAWKSQKSTEISWRYNHKYYNTMWNITFVNTWKCLHVTSSSGQGHPLTAIDLLNKKVYKLEGQTSSNETKHDMDH